MSARKGDLGSKVSSAAHVVVGCLRDYVGVDDQGARVLASLHNLLARAELFARAARYAGAGGAAGADAARLLGPIARFGGAPAEALLRRHCAEARKAQRNLLVVHSSLAVLRSPLLAALDELEGAAAEAMTAAAAAAAAAADAPQSAEASVARSQTQVMARGALALAARLRRALARDAARKADAMSAASSLALRVDAGSGAGRNGFGWLRDAPSAGAQPDSGSGGDSGDDGGEDAIGDESTQESSSSSNAEPRASDASEDVAAGLIATVARVSAAWGTELGEAGKIEAALTIVARH